MIFLDTYFQPIKNDLIEIQKNVKKDMEKKTSIKELFTKKEYRKGVIVVGGNFNTVCKDNIMIHR